MASSVLHVFGWVRATGSDVLNMISHAGPVSIQGMCVSTPHGRMSYTRQYELPPADWDGQSGAYFDTQVELATLPVGTPPVSNEGVLAYLSEKYDLAGCERRIASTYDEERERVYLVARVHDYGAAVRIVNDVLGGVSGVVEVSFDLSGAPDQVLDNPLVQHLSSEEYPPRLAQLTQLRRRYSLEPLAWTVLRPYLELDDAIRIQNDVLSIRDKTTMTVLGRDYLAWPLPGGGRAPGTAGNWLRRRVEAGTATVEVCVSKYGACEPSDQKKLQALDRLIEGACRGCCGPAASETEK
jgi:hypothetical protein